jgi:hypothetical protein
MRPRGRIVRSPSKCNGQPSRLTSGPTPFCTALGHDPEKWKSVFGQDHALKKKAGDGFDSTELIKP